MVSRQLRGALVALAIVAGGCAPALPPSTPSTSTVASTSPAPSLSSETVAPSPSSTATIPQVSVAEAVATRDAGVDPRELDVAGFLSPLPAIPCPMILVPLNPARIDCPQSFQWLMANPERLWTSNSIRPPTAPAVRPSFALVDQPLPPTSGTGAAPEPVAVELIGHFDDRRAALCPTDPEPAVPCSDTFVVDQVVSAGGRPMGVRTFEDLTDGNGNRVQPVSTADDVDRLVRQADPALVILSRRVVAKDRLKDIEPGVDAVAAGAPVTWSVVGVDLSSGPPVIARTFLVPDGGSAAVEVPQPAPS